MAIFNLKKLLLKKDITKLIEGLTVSMGVDVCIKDSAGTMLYGTGGDYLSGLPITVDGKTVGWIYGENVSKIAAMASLLNYIVGAEVQKKALAAETLNKYSELTMLYDFVEKVNAFNVKEIAEFLIKHVSEQIRADNVSVMLTDEITGMLKLVAESGGESGNGGAQMSAFGIAGVVMHSGKAEIINDCRSDPRCAMETGSVSSLICSPIKAKEKALGIVMASTIEPFNYTADDLNFFCTLVSQAAFAMDNARLYESLKEAFIKTVYTLAETIEKRDPYTGGHTKRVKEYSVAISANLGISAGDKERLELAAVLHDIGKIGVSDNVLRKTAKLTDEEFEEIKTHTTCGRDILSYIEELKGIIPGVKSHHERFDGRGYPDKLKGLEIDLIARIIAVADTFDAMTSDRPYRKGLPFGTALQELRKCSGTQFDPTVVEAFFKAVDNNKINPENQEKIIRGDNNDACNSDSR
ncbi:HD domain-containing phosphohydrolase [Candidatus Magnetominusculus dajiuhuensis]|uniref:HD domain-containing phosphohydrolase n=1 Tax=Candidatus Magnetominusculus dajiuhuensis TaxID=3137712 RepID=UPI0019F35AE9|nr:HD domain-containing protein [Nitrospirota bacterium]